MADRLISEGGKLKKEQLNQLLYEALETEMGGVEVYKTAIRCAINGDLKKEWEEYLEQTENHVQIVRGIFDKLKLDPEKETSGRKVLRHIGQSLVKAMEMALAAGNPEAAQLVATECVVEAETKDHLNWELLALVAEKVKDPESKFIQEAVEEVEEEEDEHLYHTTGWARELWVDSLGLPAALPPPEEEKDVKTAIGAARAKQDRDKMVS
jgi:ferritin-like metal-binding protein YciE